jgi:hypothetical protein
MIQDQNIHLKRKLKKDRKDCIHRKIILNGLELKAEALMIIIMFLLEKMKMGNTEP